MLEYDNNYIRRLIQLNLVGGLSPEEKGKLENWIDESEEHRLLFYKIKKQLSVNEIRNYLQTDVEDAWKKVREKTFGAPAVRPRRGLKWLKYAAVVLPVSLSLSLWYTWKEKMENKQATVACLSPVLTLDNGEKYQLDPEEQTEIYVDEEVKAYQAGGGLIYDTTARQEENKYNRIEVPRGSEYWIVLPDGTRVWLNAATELKYPVAFHAKERRVYLKGEAYFEVSKDAAHPFKVEAGAIIIQVLGTHFNVEAYPEDTQVKTTLLEGSVSVSLIGKAEESLILSPNESAIYNKDKKSLTLHTENNASEEIIWRNGTLLFKSIPLQEIVRQLSNAFHTDIRIEDADLQNYRMTATFSDGETLEEILSLLCRNQKFEYTKTNDIITITQKLN